MHDRSRGFALLIALATAGVGLASTIACEVDAGGDPSSDAGDPTVCPAELIDAGLIALCDGGFDGAGSSGGPGGGGGGDDGLVYLKIQALSGTCTGVVSTDVGCKLDPATYVATLTLGDGPTPNAGSIVMKADQTWAGSITGSVRQTQPGANGTKTCPPNNVPAVCNSFKGTDEVAPIVLNAVSIGGTGQSAVIRFSVTTIHPPFSCTDKVIEPPDDTVIELALTHSPSALRTSLVTVTGRRVFQVNNADLLGTLDCDYSITLRPSDPSGQ